MSILVQTKPLRLEIQSTAHRPQLPVVEVPVLLASNVLAALESAAHSQGVTTAVLVRRLVDRFLDGAGTVRGHD